MTHLVGDSLVMAERNLVRLPRSPDLLIGFTIQPVMFVLLFAYVFGGAIVTPGYDYVDFLIPGIIVQNIAFGGFVTALGLAEDLTKGLIDRFRSLPTARASVLAGRTLADVVTNTLSIVVLLVTGLIIGFSFDASALEIVGGVGLLLLFGFAFSWIFALLGMLVSSPEAANGVGFTLIFPITFISAAFVPVESMPSGLQEFAEVNPITIVVDAMRALWLGAPAGNSVWGAVAWSIALIVIFAPLAVSKYRRTAARYRTGSAPRARSDGGGSAATPPRAFARPEYHVALKRERSATMHRSSGSRPPENSWAACASRVTACSGVGASSSRRTALTRASPKGWNRRPDGRASVSPSV